MSSNSDPKLEDIFPDADLNHLLKDHFNINMFINKICQFVKLIPEFNKLRLDPELTLLIINICKSELKNNKFDVNEIIIKALTPIFNLTDTEQAVVKQQIIFFENNKLSKGIPISKKYIKSTTRWLSRRLG
jgi:hypothetical protein